MQPENAVQISISQTGPMTGAHSYGERLARNLRQSSFINTYGRMALATAFAQTEPHPPRLLMKDDFAAWVAFLWNIDLLFQLGPTQLTTFLAPFEKEITDSSAIWMLNAFQELGPAGVKDSPVLSQALLKLEAIPDVIRDSSVMNSLSQFFYLVIKGRLAVQATELAQRRAQAFGDGNYLSKIIPPTGSRDQKIVFTIHPHVAGERLTRQYIEQGEIVLLHPVRGVLKPLKRKEVLNFLDKKGPVPRGIDEDGFWKLYRSHVENVLAEITLEGEAYRRRVFATYGIYFPHDILRAVPPEHIFDTTSWTPEQTYRIVTSALLKNDSLLEADLLDLSE